MRKSAPVQLIVEFPGTEEGKWELARRVSEVHAEFVIRTINGLDCPIRQKLDLLQAVIDTAGKICKASGLSASEKKAGAAAKGQPPCL